ncbi:hypothetical protein [Variovorax sp. YR566]|uniref:hypothetical protein n=1 Tax=Variovorax sp. YR566 TaxID=3450237 RepID=UPI003F81A705
MVSALTFQELVFVMLWMTMLVCTALAVVVLVEASAQRGQRVYRARHRDHSKVPAMRWKDGAE